MRALFKVRLRRKDGDTQASVGKSDGGLRYGGRCFSAATALQGDRYATRRRRILTCLAGALRHPGRLAALIVVLVRTRTVYVFLSESAAGQVLRAHFNHRFFGVLPRNRYCRGILLLPEDPSQYLRGRRRHALRNNLRKAATAGIRCEVLDGRTRAVDAIEVITRTRRQAPLAAAAVSYLLSSVARPEVTMLIARDERGRPQAATAAVIDDAVCLIEWATSTSHEARWALHAHLVDVLIDRGVQYLLASGEGPFGALGFTTNVQRYQHLLGYELRHLRPIPPCASTSHERRQDSRIRPVGYVLTSAVAFLFGAVDHYFGSLWSSTHIGVWTADVSAMSAPWLALLFLVGARRRVASDAAWTGVIATLSALMGYFALTHNPIHEVAIQQSHPLGVDVSPLHIILPALLAGPLCAWFGRRWRTTMSWSTAALLASAFCLEPLVRAIYGMPFSFPGTGTAEAIIGVLLVGWFALLRARARLNAPAV